MNEESAEYRKIECRNCGWETLLDLNGLEEWLIKNGIIKPNHSVDDELLYELFHTSLGRCFCPECGTANLEVSIVTDDFSDMEPRRCRGCRNIIPPERVMFFPDVQYCASCAEKIENGEPLPIQAEYCPVCGKMMDLVEVHEGGKSYWKWICTAVPSCRYKKKKK